MGGIIQQNRNLGLPNTPVVYHQRGYADRITSSVPDLHRQETTSYRSGRRYEAPEDILATPDTRIMYPPRLALKDSRDSGHEFDTLLHRRILHQRDGDVAWQVPGGDRLNVTGPMVLNLSRYDAFILTDGAFLDVPKMTPNEIITFGQRAINAASPTHPAAGLSQFLGEFHSDGLPALTGLATMRERVNVFRSSGDEYLNVQFGWLPFIGDLKKLISSLLEAGKLLRQYKRDSGRIVRRQFHFPESIVTTDSSVTHQYGITPVFGYGDVLAPYVGNGGQISISDRVSTRIWFSGAFTYHLDVGDDILSKIDGYEQLANKLLGSRVTPAVLWEISPWSWLVDWQVSIGTALSTASMLQNDGLVIKYGYLMRHTVAYRTVSASVFGKNDDPKLTVTNAYRTERKERVAATPYGFGLSTDDFSIRQWAILAALGFTRAPKSLA